MVIVSNDRIRDTTIKSPTPANSNFGICGPDKCFWVSVDYKDFNNTHTSSLPTRRVTPSPLPILSLSFSYRLITGEGDMRSHQRTLTRALLTGVQRQQLIGER